MKLYSGTTADTGVMRATKSIGALLISVRTERIQDLKDSTIKVWVERANGDNFYIADNDLKLSDFIQHSVFGENEGRVLNLTLMDDYVTALCEISYGGSIPLLSNESIKAQITHDTVALETTVHGIEYPLDAKAVYDYEVKTLLSDEKRKTFNVSTFDQMSIDSDKFRDIHLTFVNGQRVTYTRDEFIALSRDTSGIMGNNYDPVDEFDTVMFPLLGVNQIEIEKVTGAIDLVLRRDVQ